MSHSCTYSLCRVCALCNICVFRTLTVMAARNTIQRASWLHPPGINFQTRNNKEWQDVPTTVLNSCQFRDINVLFGNTFSVINAARISSLLAKLNNPAKPLIFLLLGSAWILAIYAKTLWMLFALWLAFPRSNLSFLMVLPNWLFLSLKTCFLHFNSLTLLDSCMTKSVSWFVGFGIVAAS